jgi:hypothetical protein
LAFEYEKFMTVEVPNGDSKGIERVFLAGMGRSGTTWAAQVINYDQRYRLIFEPFLAAKVPEAEGFEYLQYLSPEVPDITLRKQVARILSGDIRNAWTDRDPDGASISNRILIKDIRCNLMLGWLQKVSPDLKILLMIRHPLQVVDSWRRLGWGVEFSGKRTDLEIIMSQSAIFDDFPLLREVAAEVDMQDFVDRTLFLWGVMHYVPMHQLCDKQAQAVFYENLLLQPSLEIRELMSFVGRPYKFTQLQEVWSQLSATNFQNRPSDFTHDDLAKGWLNKFSDEQIERTGQILGMLGLHRLYDEQGNPAQSSPFAC